MKSPSAFFLHVLVVTVCVAQPAPGQTPPPESSLGPMLIPLIVGTAGLIALIAYVVWRMARRVSRRPNQGPPRPGM